jgi:hypothetical protein
MYSITGQAAGGKSTFAIAAGSYSVTGGATILGPTLAALSGSYTVTGGSSFLPGTMRGGGGAYLITLGDYQLRRTGGEYDQVYGGIGHYLEELERARQLAKITRKTPAPIVHDIRPRLQPAAPVASAPPAIDVQAIEVQLLATQHLAEQQAQRAAVLKRRRQAAEILLLAS